MLEGSVLLCCQHCVLGYTPGEKYLKQCKHHFCSLCFLHGGAVPSHHANDNGSQERPMLAPFSGLTTTKYFCIRLFQSNIIKMNFRGPIKFVLIIRSSSCQDMIVRVQYYSKPNRARELICVKQKFVFQSVVLKCSLID